MLGLLERPGLKGGDELGLVDQADLKGEQAEEQVFLSGGVHQGDLPATRRGTIDVVAQFYRSNCKNHQRRPGTEEGDFRRRHRAATLSGKRLALGVTPEPLIREPCTATVWQHRGSPLAMRGRHANA